MGNQGTLNPSFKRRSNVELLRIIAMFLIVAHHFSLHGGFDFSPTEITINRFWIQFVQVGGKIGVNIFMLITGYFLINAKATKINKVLKLWVQIFMYSIAIFIIFVAAGIVPFTIVGAIKHIMPITYSQWQFPSAYFVIYLIFPYLNKLLTSLDKRTYQKLIILTTIFWCLIPTFLTSDYQSNYLIWFMYLYAVAGYIRLHFTNTKISNKRCILTALILIVLTFLSAVCFDFIGTKIPVFSKNAMFFYGMQKLPIVLISIFLFLGFLNTDIKYNKTINTIANATFGVYLIHDDVYVREFLWKTLFNNAAFKDSVYLIPYSIAVIVIVYSVCTLIELFRIYVLEKHYIKYIDKVSDYIHKCMHNFFNLRCSKLKKYIYLTFTK